jgi:hypothetical protein
VLSGVFTAWLFVEEGRYTMTEWWRSASRLKMLLGGVAMITVSFSAYWLQRLLGSRNTFTFQFWISFPFIVFTHISLVTYFPMFSEDVIKECLKPTLKKLLS